MTFNLEFEPTIEGSLKRHAAEHGMSPKAFAEQLVLEALLAKQLNADRFAQAGRDFDLKRRQR